MVLSPSQRDLVVTWLPGAELLADYSRDLVDTTLLHLRYQGQELAVKASGSLDRHISREISAHLRWTGPLLPDCAPMLMHAERSERILVTTWRPGDLVQGHPAEWSPDTYRQAGELLARFHAQDSRIDKWWHARQRDRIATWLDRPHRIPADQVCRIRCRLRDWRTDPVRVVPTHGDYQPRNWLIDDAGRLAVIDFGRAAWRPAATDLSRLEAQQWRDQPALAEAFFAGYGPDPRPEWWAQVQLAEAVGTAGWAARVGDEAFERQGLRMVREALAREVEGAVRC